MLTKDACSHAIRSLVLSRLDHSNSLLINVSKMDIGRLQRIQNRAARIVLRARNMTGQLLYSRSYIGCR